MNGNSKKRGGAAINTRAALSPDVRPTQPSFRGENRALSNKSKTPRKRRPPFVL
jgi:hypothetical protein